MIVDNKEKHLWPFSKTRKNHYLTCDHIDQCSYCCYNHMFMLDVANYIFNALIFKLNLSLKNNFTLNIYLKLEPTLLFPFYYVSSKVDYWHHAWKDRNVLWGLFKGRKGPTPLRKLTTPSRKLRSRSTAAPCTSSGRPTSFSGSPASENPVWRGNPSVETPWCC